MKPEINYRFLREDEAEVEYNRMHKTRNLFNVMIKRKLATDDQSEEQQQLLAGESKLVVDRELGKELRSVCTHPSPHRVGGRGRE